MVSGFQVYNLMAVSPKEDWGNVVSLRTLVIMQVMLKTNEIWDI